MKAIVLVLSVIGVLLGGLWLLQGLGLVRMKPILCFANCTPLEGPAPTWAVIGAALMAAGAFGVVRTLRRSTPRPRP